MEKLEERGIDPLLNYVLAPAYEMFADIEFHGMNVDEKELDILDRNLRRDIMEIEDDEYTINEVSIEHNLSSNDDLISILFTGEQGFNLYPIKRTDKGKPSVDKASLSTLKDLIDEELVRRSG
tara:strand:+ start:295 stop:663 length:369 start_codon:yes stop_codon:yes gene_type:complete